MEKLPKEHPGIISKEDIFNNEEAKTNLLIQIDYLVEDFVKEISGKCPCVEDGITILNYETKVKSLVPSFDIEFIDIDGEVQPFIFEDLEADSSEQNYYNLGRNKKIQFQDERRLSLDLKEIGFVPDIMEQVKKNSGLDPSFFESDSKDKKVLSNEFLKWIIDPSNIRKFLDEKKDKYKDIFKDFTREELVDRLIPMLKHIFIRRVRSKEVENYISENYPRYLRFFNSRLKDYTKENFNFKKKNESSNIVFTADEQLQVKQLNSIAITKAKIVTAVNWFENHNKEFYEKTICENYPEIDETYFEGFETNQKILLMDIICTEDKSKKTTIKIASFEDLNKEFVRIEGFRLFDKEDGIDGEELMINNSKKFREISEDLRRSFFEILIERKYLIQGYDVMKDIADNIIKNIGLSDSEKEKFDLINNVIGEKYIQSLLYKIAYSQAKQAAKRIRAAFEVIQVKNEVEKQ